MDSIIVASLIIGDRASGAITVNEVSATNNLFTLNSGNSIAINGPSTFSDVIINADGDINVNANVIVNDRDFVATVDFDQSGAGDFALASAILVSAAQDITVTAVNINN